VGSDSFQTTNSENDNDDDDDGDYNDECKHSKASRRLSVDEADAEYEWYNNGCSWWWLASVERVVDSSFSSNEWSCESLVQ